MKFLTLFFAFSLILSTTAIAGGGHNHGHGHGPAATPVNQATAKTNATKEVASLVKRKKLDKSWSDVKVNSIEKQTFNGKAEWLVTFVNSEVTDKTKQKLYVFLTLSGDYIAANYSGN